MYRDLVSWAKGLAQPYREAYLFRIGLADGKWHGVEEMLIRFDVDCGEVRHLEREFMAVLKRPPSCRRRKRLRDYLE